MTRVPQFYRQLDSKGQWLLIFATIAVMVIGLFAAVQLTGPVEGELKPTPEAVQGGCLGLYTLPECHALPKLFATSGAVVLVAAAVIYLTRRISQGRASRE